MDGQFATSLEERSLGSRLQFIDSLVRCGETPEEISYDVSVLGTAIVEKVVVELTRSGENIESEFVTAMVRHFVDYIYLGDWPHGKRRKPLLNRASEWIITGFFL